MLFERGPPSNQTRLKSKIEFLLENVMLTNALLKLRNKTNPSHMFFKLFSNKHSYIFRQDFLFPTKHLLPLNLISPSQANSNRTRQTKQMVQIYSSTKEVGPFFLNLSSFHFFLSNRIMQTKEMAQILSSAKQVSLPFLDLCSFHFLFFDLSAFYLRIENFGPHIYPV